MSNDSLGLVQRVAGFPLGITRAEFRERCLAHGGVPRGDGCNFGGADAEVWATGRWARCGERLELLLVYFRRASGALAKIAEDACDEVGGPTRLSVSCGTGQNRVLEWDWGAITLRLDLDRCSVFPNMEVRADECAGLDALPPPGQTRTPWWIPPAAAGVGR